MGQTHRIRRQSWQVAAPDAATAFAVRSLLRRDQETSLQPALERAFDAVDAGEHELHIPRLHIRLDFDTAERLHEALPEELFEATALALREALHGGTGRPSTGIPVGFSPAERLLHYLATGQLPWFDAGRDRRELVAVLAGEAILWTRTPAAAWPRLLAAAPATGHNRTDLFFRFLQLLDDSQRLTWRQFAEGLAAEQGKTTVEALAALTRLQSGRRLDPQLRLQALGLLLVACNHNGTATGRQQAKWRAAVTAVRTLLTPVTADEQTLWQLLEGAADPDLSGHDGTRVHPETTPAPETPARGSGQVSPKTATDTNPSAREGGLPGLEAAPGPHLLNHEAASDLAPHAREDGRVSRSEKNAVLPGFEQTAEAAIIPEPRFIAPLDRGTEPGMPVQACGLVLLHPYLPRLFTGLSWIGDDHPLGEPLPPATLPPAAALLHWLATGNDNPYEFELPLIKLLLGLAPGEPLPVAAGLLDALAREEGKALLSAAISHWPAFGQTSIEGLRHSFLKRDGLLYQAADGWLLRPQTKTYDLLLDRLPWGISILRLPWMRSILHTEWNAV